MKVDGKKINKNMRISKCKLKEFALIYRNINNRNLKQLNCLLRWGNELG
jgi:hypothetical protein